MQLSAADWCFLRPGIEPAAYYRALAAAGYGAAEMVAPEHRSLARAAGLTVLNLSGPGMRKGLNRPGHHAALVPRLRAAIQEAGDDGIPFVIVFSGNAGGQTAAHGIEAVGAGLTSVLGDAERAGVTLLFEMLCQRDHPDYQADHTAYGVQLVQHVGSERLKLLYDVYHMQQMGEDVHADLTRHLPLIGHIHLAQTPSRSELSDAALFGDIRAIVTTGGYTGWLGMEFIPTGEPIAALHAARSLLLG